MIDDTSMHGRLVVTVCDHAHEELESAPDWLHWSIPDPVAQSSPEAFDAALAEVEMRIKTLTGPRS